MQLALHIFRKDIHHLRWHIALSYLLTAAVMWSSQMAHGYSLLLILYWSILIALLVHQEPLAGERSYWLTRPIPRMSLLGAKALALAASIQLPVFILDCIVLIRSGHSPLSYAGGLAMKQLMLLTSVVLPLFAIASLTRSIGQHVTALAAIAGVIVGMANLPGVSETSNDLPWLVPTAARSVNLVAFGWGCIWLFRKRQIRTARLATAALLFLLGLMFGFAPYGVVFAVQAKLSPEPQPPLPIEFDTARRPEPAPWVPPDSHRIDLGLKVPAERETVRCLRQTATVILPNGKRISSLQPSFFYAYNKEKVDRPTISLFLDDRTFLRYKDRPVEVRLTFYLARLRAAAVGDLMLPDGKTTIAGLGTCSGSFNHGNQYYLIRCANPLRDGAGFDMRVTSRSGREIARSNNRLHVTSPLPANNVIPTMSDRGLHSFFIDTTRGNTPYVAYDELRGARAHIETYEPAAFFKSELTIKGIHLSTYEVKVR